MFQRRPEVSIMQDMKIAFRIIHNLHLQRTDSIDCAYIINEIKRPLRASIVTTDNDVPSSQA